jgi:nitrogen fixation protein NifZ
MKPEYDYGDVVRVVRTIRDDGTFPGKQRGDLIVRKGNCGYVRDVGVFLQDQLIYQVHFIEEDLIVGCRSQELISADEPWVESEFEFGDWINAVNHLAIKGEVIAEAGSRGQVMSVRRDMNPIMYEVLFQDRMLLVPLSAICWPQKEAPAEEVAC